MGFDKLEARRVMAVVALDDAGDATELGRALDKGGLDVVEITFRTPAAPDVIRRLRQEFPHFGVAAGTVLDTTQVEQAKAAGAHFVVTPGLDEAVVRRAQEIGLPIYPGVMTATELQAALRLGCKTVKVYPIEPMGGAAILKILAGPFTHCGVRFMPTGGITPHTMGSYLDLPSVVSVGGTWIAPPDLIAARDWKEIEQRARVAVSVAAAHS